MQTILSNNTNNTTLSVNVLEVPCSRSLYMHIPLFGVSGRLMGAYERLMEHLDT